MTASDDEPLHRAWTEVEAAWGDEAAHERAVALADALDRLGELGARYRKVRDEGGPRAELAERFQKQIVSRALGRLKSTPQKVSTKSRLEWIMMGISVALVAAALWSVLRTFQ